MFHARNVRALALVAALVLPAQAAAQLWQARVQYVVDGDTLFVTPAAGGRRVKLRLRGMDAPESCQPGGEAARRVLRALAQGEQVQVRVLARDRYGRSVADVWRASDGVNLAERMVSEGWAWSDARKDSPYAMQQVAAQVARRGVFAQAGALRPAEFRRRHGSCRR